ncbi:MAG TPA: response regulator, partial [Candidatus Limnocylindria bacterium]|nr:response regulator [Candidatus Limnocylindria bacterium]
MHDRSYRVLIVDRDADLAELVAVLLRDAGYTVSTLQRVDHDAIATAVNREEPDCILLDSENPMTYGRSWLEAAYLAGRSRSIPTVMFATQPNDLREARDGDSRRAVDARLAAVIAKPFDLDELLDTVAAACRRAAEFERGEAADRQRSAALAERLRATGATDIRTSDRREWATFRFAHEGPIHQVYWWEQFGVYLLGRYDGHARLELLGQFLDLESAIAAAMQPADAPRLIDQARPIDTDEPFAL